MSFGIFQGWSCCKRRTTDFSDFLSIVVSVHLCLLLWWQASAIMSVLPHLSVYTDFHRCGEDIRLITHTGHPTNCLSSFRAAQRDPTTKRNLLSQWSRRWSLREKRKTLMTKNPSLMNILSLHQSPRRPYKDQGMYVGMWLLFISVSQYCNETLSVFCCVIEKTESIKGTKPSVSHWRDTR